MKSPCTTNATPDFYFQNIFAPLKPQTYSNPASTRAHASMNVFMTLWILDLPELIQHKHDEALKHSYVFLLRN